MTVRLALAILSVAVLGSMAAGCAPRRIPGTEIDDTDETRAILEVMKQYRIAVEHKDAQGVISLVSESFKDDFGTPSPEDDLDYAKLREKLPQLFSRVDEPHLDLEVRKIEILEAGGRADSTPTARAVFTYTESFKLPGLTSKPHNDSEIKEMRFARVGDAWKITSGI
jgi:hypothetical protein